MLPLELEEIFITLNVVNLFLWFIIQYIPQATKNNPRSLTYCINANTSSFSNLVKYVVRFSSHVFFTRTFLDFALFLILSCLVVTKTLLMSSRPLMEYLPEQSTFNSVQLVFVLLVIML